MTNTTERRIRAAWRSRACAAAVCSGAQVFLFGAGIAMPLCLNSAWIAALAALPASALLVYLCRRALLQRCADGRAFLLPRGCALWLFSSFILHAAFASASVISLAEQTLLPQARTVWSAAVTALFLFLSSLSGGTGVSRLCYSVRFALPAALLALSAASLPLRQMGGIFPLLGAGALPLAAAAIIMPGAAVPALLLLLPPPELQDTDSALLTGSVPPYRFFLFRILAGAGTGAALIFLLCACSTYESIAGLNVLGERLRIASSAKPHEGLPQAALLLCQTVAAALLAVSMLCSAGESLRCAWPALRRSAALIPGALLAALLFLLILSGFSFALYAAPLLILPAGAALILHHRSEKHLS